MILAYALVVLFCFGGVVAALALIPTSDVPMGGTPRKVALCGSQAAETASPASRRELETSSFEAYTHCGGCGKLDYHPMREPRRVRSDRSRALKSVVSRRGEVDIRAFGGWTLEEDFDVIRECSCGHAWGQR